MRRQGPNRELTIEAVEKAVVMLEYLASSDQALSLQQIAGGTGMAKSSVYRILQTWELLGYVERTGPDGHFRLGIRALLLGRNVASRNRFVELTETLFRRFHERFRESVYLGLYRKGNVILINAIQSTQTVRVVVDLGEMCTLHASAQGRCVAAFLDPEVLWERFATDGLRKITPKTNTDPARLRRILAEIRLKEYAINWEETAEGCVCVAAPLFAGRDGVVLGSLGISAPLHRVSGSMLEEVVSETRRIAEEMSSRLTEFSGEPECLTKVRASELALRSGLEPVPKSRAMDLLS